MKSWALSDDGRRRKTCSTNGNGGISSQVHRCPPRRSLLPITVVSITENTYFNTASQGNLGNIVSSPFDSIIRTGHPAPNSTATVVDLANEFGIITPL